MFINVSVDSIFTLEVLFYPTLSCFMADPCLRNIYYYTIAFHIPLLVVVRIAAFQLYIYYCIRTVLAALSTSQVSLSRISEDGLRLYNASTQSSAPCTKRRLRMGQGTRGEGIPRAPSLEQLAAEREILIHFALRNLVLFEVLLLSRSLSSSGSRSLGRWSSRRGGVGVLGRHGGHERWGRVDDSLRHLDRLGLGSGGGRIGKDSAGWGERVDGHAR